MLTRDRLMERLTYDRETGVFHWRVTTGNTVAGRIAGCLNGDNQYTVIRIDGHLYLAHRLAWLYVTGAWPRQEIDHIDLCRHNNAWINLREATHSQNLMNTRPRSKRQPKGIRFHKCGLWQIRIHIDGKEIPLGYSKCPAAASIIYQIAADKMFGEYARPF